jgi:hypothetical protein
LLLRGREVGGEREEGGIVVMLLVCFVRVLVMVMLFWIGMIM